MDRTEDTPNLPRKRAGNAERERTEAMLREAYADGQLTLPEFDERTQKLWAATFADELAPLTADLSVPGTTPGTTPGTGVAPRAAHSPSYLQQGGSALSVSMMGEVERTGDWHIAPTHTSITVMGGNTLDLRGVQLSAQETTVNAFAVMGGIDIIVPEDVRVIDDGVGLMGGFGITTHPSCTVAQGQLLDDAPVIRIRGLALMGAVDIVRAARGAHVER